jgi:hypothetical protein
LPRADLSEGFRGWIMASNAMIHPPFHIGALRYGQK